MLPHDANTKCQRKRNPEDPEQWLMAKNRNRWGGGSMGGRLSGGVQWVEDYWVEVQWVEDYSMEDKWVEDYWVEVSDDRIEVKGKAFATPTNRKIPKRELRPLEVSLKPGIPSLHPISLSHAFCRPVSMREVQEPQLADTPEIIQSPVVGKRGSPYPLLFPKQSHLLSRTDRVFWSAGKTDIPSFACSPWDFYEKFCKLRLGSILVLCNDKSAVRNFVDICESYLYERQVLAITKFVGYSLEDNLQCGIRPSEPEIAYIISQVLVGIRFIWSRKLGHARISARNVFVSPNSDEVKIDPTDFPSNDGQSSANMDCLKTLMLRMMHETSETLNKLLVEACSFEALNFMAATSWASPDELCNVSLAM
ncbi:hypothetical protein V500_07609 [Pseudogymnoascus sp. VKM F-4518 (FW-2643)]|nr:hypothetical protein V500_07609 [Pseudogymnoascus sp. VKM F-4518 (FW-2643)]